MKEVTFSQQELILLKLLLEEQITILKSRIQPNENTLSEKGNNANFYIKVSEIENLLEKIDRTINN